METHGSETGSTEPGTRTHVLELYVRSLAPPGAIAYVEAVVDGALALERRGVVDDATVTVWGDGVCPESTVAGTPAGRHVLDRVTAVCEWARRTDADLGPFFEPHTVRSTITGEDYPRIPFPVVTLVEVLDGEIVDVAPCIRDGTCHCVEDALDRLDANAVPDALDPTVLAD